MTATEFVAYDAITCAARLRAQSCDEARRRVVEVDGLDDDRCIVVIEMPTDLARQAISDVMDPMFLHLARQVGTVAYEGVGARRMRDPDAA